MSITATEAQPVEAIELKRISQDASPTKGHTFNETGSPEEPSDHGPRVAGLADRKTLLKVISAGFSFLVARCSDGSIGALIPYMIKDYKINTAIVSSM